MTGRLAGKTALITGGAMGMGAAHARAFVAEGAQVVIADLADDAGTALADELGDAARFVHLNVTDPAQWESAVAETVGHFGKLNVLINNAGIFTTGSLEEYTLETWDKTLAINLTGAFLGLKSAVAALAEAAPASVVNISSTAGIEGYPGFHGYSASKWGLRGLTRSAALELADRSIRVNSVHPGGIATPLLQALRTIEESDLEGSTLERLARPEEITGLLVFLASDESSFVTGAEHVIDGGVTAGTMV
ncbi:glucose 1-dehydrogenase [Microbacterium sp. A196]|uniref:glucose 1-dehydrogenase n=1 Tax=unclassified Microbacterium TaxID=2609290 RepID=UPI003FD11C5C